MQVGSRWCPRRVVMPVMVMMKAALAGLGAALGGGALLLGLTMSSSAAAPPPSRPPICTTSGGIAALSPAQAQNARIVHATGLARGGGPAAYIALMTGLAESNLLV